MSNHWLRIREPIRSSGDLPHPASIIPLAEGAPGVDGQVYAETRGCQTTSRNSCDWYNVARVSCSSKALRVGCPRVGK